MWSYIDFVEMAHCVGRPRITKTIKHYICERQTPPPSSKYQQPDVPELVKHERKMKTFPIAVKSSSGYFRSVPDDQRRI